MISPLQKFVSAEAPNVGSLTFFFVNNLSGDLSFKYSNPEALEASVTVCCLSSQTTFYTQTHSLSNGVLTLQDIPLSGEGTFRLEIRACGSALSRDFAYIGSDYVTDFPEVGYDAVLAKLSSLDSDSHPYLFGTETQFDALAQKIQSSTDSYLSKSYSEIKEYALKICDESVKEFDTSGSYSYISRGFESWKNVMFSSFVYLMEKDIDSNLAAKFAQRAYSEAEYLCSKDTWGTLQYIDNNQLAFAVALCYDWLYNWLDDTQKSTLVTGLKEKHLNTVSDLLNNPEKKEYQSTFYLWYTASGNHTVLDNSSTVVQALSIADLDPAYSAKIIAPAINNLQKPLARLAPDSMWGEGAGYWTFVGPFVARMIYALDTSIGTSFGYSELPVIKNLGYFPIYQQSTQGSFVFCDAGDSFVTSPERFYLGMLADDIGMQSYSLANSPADPLLCMWYDPGADYTDSNSFQSDMLYRNGDTVTMRSGWNSNTELFAAMSVNKHDAESTSGLYQNSGTFVIDALGEQWIKNPGRDSYKLPNYAVPHKADTDPRWKYYFSRAEANSCIVINPDSTGGQNLLFGDTISGFDASSDEAYAYASMANAYAGKVSSYVRGIKMYDSRRRVLVKDELTLAEPSEVYSFLSVYQSDITLLPDGSGAILAKGNKKMLVKIKASSKFELSVTDAVQLDPSLRYTSDTISERDWTLDFQRLTIHFDNAKALDISMIFTPFYGDEVPEVTFDTASINDWEVSHKSTVLPKLSQLCIDGEPVENFDSNVNCHNLTSRSFSPVVTAFSDDGTVAIRKDGSGYSITVTSGEGAYNTYYITIRTLGSVEADTHVGGGYSDYKKNNGTDELVLLKINGWSSKLAYYKIALGNIPKGKHVKNVCLELCAYRESSSETTEPLGIYLTNYDSWQENSITCANAPVSLGYKHSVSTDPWFPIKSYDAVNDSYTDINPDLTVAHNFEHTVPFYYIGNESDFRKETVDITDVYNASGKSTNLSFTVAVSKRNAANSVVYIASKEHSNTNFRPRVLIELEDEISVKTPKLISAASYQDNLTYSSAARVGKIGEGDSLRALSYVFNGTDHALSGTLYSAQYDAKGCLLSVTSAPFTNLPSGETANPVSDQFDVHPDTSQIKTFVWDSYNTPFTKADVAFPASALPQ